ncbi:ATP/GTP-binding protein [Corynebacterium sp. A21]|uniref:ATP/GTP-binding protein n=1 Tax=Corynebacterium sp. A21 TaxID=3457318 RepID=UPI003FD4A07B
MTTMTKNNGMKRGSETRDLEELHGQIIGGEREAPPAFSRLGRRYRRWKKDHDRQAQRIARMRRQAGGEAPVVYENPYGAPRDRGFTGLASGHSRVVSGPQEWQTTTNLSCGFNPNVVGAPSPVIGTPLGRHLLTGTDVACDALSWWREGIISNPSAFILSLPGLGKSTLIRKMLMGHVAQGHVPIIAGDIKAEYVGFTRQVGGQVITLGHGHGTMNPLDAGALGSVIPTLEAHRKKLEEAAMNPPVSAEKNVVDQPEEATRGTAVISDLDKLDELIARTEEQVHGRQVTMVTALVALGRQSSVEDWESMLISVALRELYASEKFGWGNPPVLQDLIDQLETGSEELKRKGRARDHEQWNQRIDNLALSLNALMDGAVGRIFSGPTTTPIDVNATAVCIDVSAIDRGDKAVKAAVMMACWSASFGSIEACHLLADAGLGEQKYFAAALDELWQILSAAPGLVEQIDGLSRLNRSSGLCQYLITHTCKDLEALPTEEDRKTAMGFIERAGMVITGGLPVDELDRLTGILAFSSAEAEMITSWSAGAPPKRSRTRGSKATPPGRGRFMIKPAKDGSPGIPVQTMLFPTEIREKLHDTNHRFEDFFLEGEQE